LIDLSLILVRVYWRLILGWAILGAIPFSLVNAFCLYQMTDFDAIVIFNYDILDPGTLRFRYILWMIALVFLETPLALLGLTFFLGQSVFFGSPSFTEFKGALKQSFWGILWVLGILRLGVIGWLIALRNTTSDGQVDLFFEVFFYGFVLIGAVVFLRSIRPFAPEMLILERSPLRSPKSPGGERGVAYGKRTKWLHRPIVGALFGRSIVSTIVSLFLLFSLSFGWLFLRSIFFNSPSWDWCMDYILFPLTLWIIAIWATIIRFLSYLDIRTRLEGWELELRLRAEGNRVREAME